MPSASPSRPVPWTEHLIFLLLLLPTTLSIVLLLADSLHWTIADGSIYGLINSYRTSVQTGVQALATLLSTVQLLIICRLINQATRIRFAHHSHHHHASPTHLTTLSFWASLSTPAANWTLPPLLLCLTFLLANLSAVLSALWTGALTPTTTTTTHSYPLNIPSYHNTSFIIEYPSQIDRTGPTARTPQGYFTYSVGLGQLTALISSASTASPLLANASRVHPKLDNTGYSYTGRSYGVGTSVGLTDSGLRTTYPHATGYTYVEPGYVAHVECAYNRSSAFRLEELGEYALYAARGPLPDSVNASRRDAGEYSVYTGYSTRTIVAVGVAAQPVKYTRERYVAVAAGGYYAGLNASQCVVVFEPAWFRVEVAVAGKVVRVVPGSGVGNDSSSSSSSDADTSASAAAAATAAAVGTDKRDDDAGMGTAAQGNETAAAAAAAADIDPTNKTIHVAMRQLELISNDLTSFYRSTLGDAFNTSIADYRTSVTMTRTTRNTTTTTNTTNIANTPTKNMTEDAIALAGITNVYVSLIDDILAGYASAQLMVGGFTQQTAATVTVEAFRVGSHPYIVCVFVTSLGLLLVVAAEMVRTRLWRGLPRWDYMEMKMVVAAASNGGRGIAERAAEKGWGADAVGRIPVRLVGGDRDQVAGGWRLVVEDGVDKEMLLLEGNGEGRWI
ncbi:hypothetical protein BO82DRAFT_356433 [Aspergillus uvarum CBS 121591]|uniref:Uncharacterized protein n=1 Tax=Aspergillus uvarum CBS 121591 TaxID=1448315 RepID=A0A319C5R4_9EURO|nr:hypothetical protein BO82DRAFT_356433 [Aspergillus uvarum CBS 121591]PYH79461.1 hypothetical protein BO82DRAFT_356433 [Aspergillus uvarum CBS 121591]